MPAGPGSVCLLELVEWNFLDGFGGLISNYLHMLLTLCSLGHLKEPTEHTFVTFRFCRSFFAVDGSYLIKPSPVLLKLKLFHPHSTKLHRVLQVSECHPPFFLLYYMLYMYFKCGIMCSMKFTILTIFNCTTQ